MLRQVSVKLSLFSFAVLLLVWGCGPVGGGNSYKSEVYEYTDSRYRGGIEVSQDRRKIRIYENWNCGGAFSFRAGAWVDLTRGGISQFYRCNNTGSYLFRIEVTNGKIRGCIKKPNAFITNCGAWIPLCPQGGGTSSVESYRIDTNSSNYIRFCFRSYYTNNWICGNWVQYYCGPSCPEGYTYDSALNICIANPVYTCPTGYTYNSSTGKCEATPDAKWACPLDPNRPCIQEGNGYFCSPYDCVDATSTPPTNTDTQQGANDIPADGEVTEQGCLGTVYIFNGRDMRCRPPGVQTGFSNCCKKTRTWFGLGRCNETEQALAKLRSWGKLDGNCHYVGEYCAEEWLGTCVQKKRTYCCFSSPLARIIHEQGRPQLGIGWGSAESPNCRGFTAQEFQKLDFSKIDFSEWIEEEVKKNVAPQINQSISNVINQIPSQFEGGQ